MLARADVFRGWRTTRSNLRFVIGKPSGAGFDLDAYLEGRALQVILVARGLGAFSPFSGGAAVSAPLILSKSARVRPSRAGVGGIFDVRLRDEAISAPATW